MDLFLAGLLGALQGLTEFFPVSSSGHLALFSFWFGLPNDDLTFEILVHLATLAAIVTYFRKDWVLLAKSLFSKENGDLPNLILLYLIVSMIPAGVVGIFFKDAVVWMNHQPVAIGFCLCLMGGLLLLGLKAPSATKALPDLSWTVVVAMAMAQALAILPGISRSGITILCAIFLGLQKPAAARYSFLMAVPVIGGAGLLAILDLLDKIDQLQPGLLAAYAVGFLSALISGFFALAFLMRLLNGNRFFYFGWYCLAMGILAIVL